MGVPLKHGVQPHAHSPLRAGARPPQCCPQDVPAEGDDLQAFVGAAMAAAWADLASTGNSWLLPEAHKPEPAVKCGLQLSNLADAAVAAAAAISVAGPVCDQATSKAANPVQGNGDGKIAGASGSTVPGTAGGASVPQAPPRRKAQVAQEINDDDVQVNTDSRQGAGPALSSTDKALSKQALDISWLDDKEPAKAAILEPVVAEDLDIFLPERAANQEMETLEFEVCTNDDYDVIVPDITIVGDLEAVEDLEVEQVENAAPFSSKATGTPSAPASVLGRSPSRVTEINRKDSIDLVTAAEVQSSSQKQPVSLSVPDEEGETELPVLVLDVDSTLVHTVRRSSFSHDLRVMGYVNEQGKREVFESGKMSDGQQIYCKLRPGVHAFLAALKNCYRMHIFSCGNPEYLEFIITLIDPDNDIFLPGCVATRPDLEDFKFKHLRNVRTSPQRVVIFDDRRDVWEKEIRKHSGELALVQAYPYEYFETHADVILGGKQGRHLPKDLDAHLPCAARYLQALCQDMVGPRQLSAFDAMNATNKKTLAGLRIGVLEYDGDGRLCQDAQAFGARVEKAIYPGLHVVVVQGLVRQHESDHRFQEARRHRVPIVHRAWLNLCFATFGLQDPMIYALGQEDLYQCPWEAYWAAHSKSANGGTEAIASSDILKRLESLRRRRLSQH